ncbi:DUF4157 domain-containing protein [Shewanella frigidimarina]|uniref:eCIS core domain-containing protein n=1 Tax=Shewanella frigidimarina TaxID=56812 RepID=UPI001F3848F9|nr:DUF4157 domain-containing protein [Shewanella frigidimarina]
MSSVSMEDRKPQLAQRANRQTANLKSKAVSKGVIEDNRPQSLQLLQLKSSLEEEEKLGQRQVISTHVSQPMQRAANRYSNNTGLPANLKSGMESLSGMSLDHVNVHYNSSKPASVQAHAYAQGSDIHLASGQEKHLPHELGHVVQQAQGRVKPTTSVSGMAVNDNPSLESEADSLGAKALQMKHNTGHTDTVK